jgi:hypothetical protein
MPFGSGTSQSQVSAGGDVVAGNLHRTTTSHTYYGTSGNSRVDYLAALGRQFLAEQEQNQGIGHIIDKLLRYSTPVQEEATLMIGLENKLEEGGYVPYLLFAAQTKEHFTKHLLSTNSRSRPRRCTLSCWRKCILASGSTYTRPSCRAALRKK